MQQGMGGSQMSGMGGSRMGPEMEECIVNCWDCHRTCLETISHCLQMGGMHAEPNHIKLLQDCAQICATSADFMVRMSQHHAMTCGVCAEICAACADDCRRMADGDPVMAECAETCTMCADSCRRMSHGHQM